MTLTLPIIILAAGLWLILLAACFIFLMVAINFKKRLESETEKSHLLYTELEKLKTILLSNSAAEVPVLEPFADTQVIELSNTERNEFMQQINSLETQLEILTANAEKESVAETSTQDLTAEQNKPRKLQEKNAQLKLSLTEMHENLADAEDQIATLEGARQALQSERDSLERQLTSLSETMEATSDSDTMREIIVNFTEESRELLSVIETLGKEKSELYQKIADMESGGKGTAGAVVGLKRKLTETELELQALKALQNM